MKEVITVIAGVVAIPAIFFLVVMAFYMTAGFMAWVASDPIDLFEDGAMLPSNFDKYSEGEQKWDACIRSTKTIFDNFNDTVGSSYALGDTPSTESQEFMKLCLERRQ